MLSVENPRISQLTTMTSEGEYHDQIWQDALTRFLDGYKAEKKHFLDTIEGISLL